MIIPNIEQLSQEEIVAYHLLHEGDITSKEAIEEYGITRLAAYIFNLRNFRKWNIVSKDESGKNRFGKKVVYTRYYFQKEA